jgi:Ca2+-binding EF-hand superfamily protein
MLAKCGSRLGPREVRVFMQSMDDDRDGTVTFAEMQSAQRRFEASSPQGAAASPEDVELAAEVWDQLLSLLDDSKAARSVSGLFKALDANGDKSLSMTELTRGLQALGLSPSAREVGAFQRILDKDADGIVSLREFTSAVGEEREGRSQVVSSAWSSVLEASRKHRGGLAGLFRDSDRDADGGLELDEVAGMMAKCGSRLSPREVRVFMQSMDGDRDGTVTFAEMQSAQRRFEVLFGVV